MDAELIVLIVIAVELAILLWMVRWAIRTVCDPTLGYLINPRVTLPWPNVNKGNIDPEPPVPDPMDNRNMGDHLYYAICAMKTYLTMHQQRPLKPIGGGSPATPPPPGPPSP
jgi:hypothetical protein